MQLEMGRIRAMMGIGEDLDSVVTIICLRIVTDVMIFGLVRATFKYLRNKIMGW